MLYAQYLGEQQDGKGSTYSLFDIIGDGPYNQSTMGLDQAIKIGVKEVRYASPNDQPLNQELGALNAVVEEAKSINLMLKHGLNRKGLQIEKRGDSFIWRVDRKETI